ncbi:MAG: hypothetical protein N3B21_05090 [Clostridia bacterium]|nr:hypothetical protein [Clostridia bacterium]
MKRFSQIVLVLVVAALGVTGCGKNNDTNKTQASSTAAKEIPTPQVDSNNKSNMPNLEALKEYLRETEARTEFAKTSIYESFIGNFNSHYKRDITNPNNGAASIYAESKTPPDIAAKDVVLGGISGSVIVIANNPTLLKDTNADGIVYACNEKNKGAVIGVVFRDGFHAYEVDAKGNKTNGYTYMFPSFGR